MAFVPAVLVAAGIAVLSLVENADMPRVVINDKLVHGAMYAVFAMTLMIPYRLRTSWMVYVTAWAIASGYGVLMENLQEVCTTTRVMDVQDMFANVIGGLVGLLLFALIHYLWTCRKTSTR
ncbi:MAG: VanZ family protein [Paludibacteraceae bacterium]|nr:VanZ family protein [Paludibacteraceae bacterium]